MAKVLIFDIETAPSLAYVWRFFKENISAKQVKENGYMLSFAAKWLGEEGVMYRDCRTHNEAKLLKQMCDLLDQADVVIAHNGDRFDISTIRGRCLVHNLNPPEPFKSIDTLKVAKSQFRFESNSLEYLADLLGCSSKMTNRKFPGFELWAEVLKDNPEAWEELRVYNIQDVHVLEEVYLKMRPWITNHPNLALMDGSLDTRCTKCTSSHIHYRGYAHTNVSRFRKFQCQDCGGWGRERVNQMSKEEKEALATNVSK